MRRAFVWRVDEVEVDALDVELLQAPFAGRHRLVIPDANHACTQYAIVTHVYPWSLSQSFVVTKIESLDAPLSSKNCPPPPTLVISHECAHGARQAHRDKQCRVCAPHAAVTYEQGFTCAMHLTDCRAAVLLVAIQCRGIDKPVPHAQGLQHRASCLLPRVDAIGAKPHDGHRVPIAQTIPRLQRQLS